MRRAFKFFLTVAAGIAILLLGEALFFAWILHRPSDVSAHDVVVVFAGSDSRVGRAYELARQGVAPKLIISPASPKVLAYYEKRYGPPGRAEYLIEPSAETTLTNALYTARLIKENQLKSVLLVTSAYHMPRSYLLLKIATLGRDCRIGIHKLEPPGERKWSRGRWVAYLKLLYNEMVQVWGSLGEGVLLCFYGEETPSVTRTSAIARALREMVLFRVEGEGWE